MGLYPRYQRFFLACVGELRLVGRRSTRVRPKGEDKRGEAARKSLRACLHGVGNPGLVGLVSFVFTLWGTQKKETYPTRPGSPTPCKQGLRLDRNRKPRMKSLWHPG